MKAFSLIFVFRSTFLNAENANVNLFAYINAVPSQQQQKPNRYFKPMTVASPVETNVIPPPMTGGPARRTLLGVEREWTGAGASAEEEGGDQGATARVWQG